MKTIIGVDLGKMTGVAIKRPGAKSIRLLELPIPEHTDPFVMAFDFGDMILDVLKREAARNDVHCVYEIAPMVHDNPKTYAQMCRYESELVRAAKKAGATVEGINNKTAKLRAFGDGGLSAKQLKGAAEKKIETHLPISGELTEHTAMAYALICAYEKGE